MNDVVQSDSRLKMICGNAGHATGAVALLSLWLLWLYGSGVGLSMLFGEDVGTNVISTVAVSYFAVTAVAGGLLGVLKWSPEAYGWCCESKAMKLPAFALISIVFTSPIFLFVLAFSMTKEFDRR